MRHLTICCCAAILLNGLARPVAAATLEGHWTFDETSGPVAHDSSGNGIDGTLQGGAVFAPGLGISGGAISLDKLTTSFVNMGNNFDYTGDMSLQAWVKLSVGDTSFEAPVVRHWSTHVAGYFLA